MGKVLRYGFGILLVVLLIMPTANARVEKGDIIIGPSLQAGLPMGDFGDVAGFGIGIGGVGDYVIGDNLAVGADIVYNFFGSEVSDEDAEGVDIKGPKVLQFGGHAKMYFSPEAETNPYIFGGLAIYSVKQTVSAFGFSASATSSEFGFNGGGGAQFKAGESMRLAAQGHIHIIMSDPSAMYVGGALTLLFNVGGGN